MNVRRTKRDKVIVIGAGFSGLSAAAHLAADGFDVTIVEKHQQAGGRARTWSQDGFTFDMGPSWYWMPDLFDRWFERFGHRPSDFYDLRRLDPSYRVYWPTSSGGGHWDIPAGLGPLRELFERTERGAGASFDRFIEQTRYIYETAVGDYLLRPSLSFMEFFDVRLVSELFKLKMLTSMHRFAGRFFEDPRLVQLCEWPVLFLGASAKDTSAMYGLMSYADMALGTWYPMGGMHRIIEAMVTVAKSQGATLKLGHRVDQIVVEGGRAAGVVTPQGTFRADAVVAAADYHFVESMLLPTSARQFSERSWQRKTMSPSSLLFYLGVDRKLDGFDHHMLFFDEDLDRHMDAVYKRPRWPKAPLFYTCSPSRTDPSVAPEGCENLFILVPLAAGLKDAPDARDVIYRKVMGRIQRQTGIDVDKHVVVKRSYAMDDFVADYGAFKGNAYGMANTLRQTGPLKPPLKSRRVDGLYFAGQLTVPGPGMPPSLVSGELAAQVVARDRAAVKV